MERPVINEATKDANKQLQGMQGIAAMPGKLFL